MQERATKVLRFAVTGALLGTAGAASGCESLSRLFEGEPPSTNVPYEEPQRFAPNPGPNELDPPQPDVAVEVHPNVPPPPPEGATEPALPHPNAAPVEPVPAPNG
ncbi:MAG: hypothetical protein M3Y87_24135 [Myxococcota bacterium]|nr:hypothetical protein [Myxococcota bacterium]